MSFRSFLLRVRLCVKVEVSSDSVICEEQAEGAESWGTYP